mgnify:CR=1 FL=1
MDVVERSAGEAGDKAETAAVAAAELVKRMTLEEKIGQMVLCGFTGTEPSADIERLIRDEAVGGVILFARNVQSTEQVARLNRSLQAAASIAGRLPLWISIDQEGGMVARITDGVALMPGAMAIAAGGSAEDAYEAASISGRELKALGINLNFAPVLDVNNNPANPVIGVRSFGEDPGRVAELGVATIHGLQEAGVVATAKHFPGHGDTHVDSHLALPTVAHALERLELVELRPFREAIAAGVDAIMSAHIVFPAYEPAKLPVTLSHAALTGLLRGELGYQGVIMTDCMEMNAIAEHFGTVEAAVMAVEAGADLVLISHSHERQLGALEALRLAVLAGRIREERIDRSVERLLALKARRGVLAPAAAGGVPGGTAAEEPQDEAVEPALVPPLVGCEAHLAAAQRISEASITVVRNERGLLPLAKDRSLVVISVEAAVQSEVDELLEAPLSLGKALVELGACETEWLVPLRKVGELKEELVRSALFADQVVVATYNAYLEPDQAELIRALQARGKDPIVVALRSPYDLLAFPDVGAFMAVYESRPLALRSAAKVLTGGIPAAGRLPISLGGQATAGSGADGSQGGDAV